MADRQAGPSSTAPRAVLRWPPATHGRAGKRLRRHFLKLAGAALAAPAFPQPASADDYPTRPVRIIAGFVAGGGVDITARLIGQWVCRPAWGAGRGGRPPLRAG